MGERATFAVVPPAGPDAFFPLWSDTPKERHECPPWCHECPDMGSKDGVPPEPLEVMPWCMNGVYLGLAECCCSHENPQLSADVLARGQWFAKENRREMERRAQRPPDQLRARRKHRNP